MASAEASFAITATLPVLVSDLLSSLEHPALRPVQALWPPLPSSSQTRSPSPSSGRPLAVLDWLMRMSAAPDGFAGPLIDALCRAAPTLHWRQTYSPAEVGAEFLRNYAYAQIMGPDAAWRCDHLRCGFLLLGPGTDYPWHHHEAEELYLTLSGTAAWCQGDAAWREHAPGTVVHHAGGEPHAMHTGAGPLLALYVWYGSGLEQSARLSTA